MSRQIDFPSWFLPERKARPIKMGAEIELLLFDSRNKEPLRNMSLLERILSNLPDQIWHDYYPYQLEIRTQAHSDPEELIKETLELYRLASREFLKKHKIFVVPVPSVTDGLTYCGLHTHLSFDTKEKMDYWRFSMGLYPYLLALTDHTKNFETETFKLSERLDKSHHIGLPDFDPNKFLKGNRGGNNDREKYKDLILSNPNDGTSSRSRMRKPTTIEIRMLDTPSLVSHYEFIIRYLFHLGRRLRFDNPCVSDLKSRHSGDFINNIDMTRRLMIHQRYGFNKVFRMSNLEVCEDICEYFGINFPNVTQFEYREERGVSGDINGFLSMATEGGWL